MYVSSGVSLTSPNNTCVVGSEGSRCNWEQGSGSLCQHQLHLLTRSLKAWSKICSSSVSIPLLEQTWSERVGYNAVLTDLTSFLDSTKVRCIGMVEIELSAFSPSEPGESFPKFCLFFL